jgi:23S rRNA (pseudouridine1915-N3)-methyltransferase
VGRDLLVVWAGRHQRPVWEQICADYRKRIGRLAPVRDVPIRVRSDAADPKRRREEGRAILTALPPSTWTIALDVAGDAVSSDELARRLARLRSSWPHPVAFLIGSDLGLDPAVLAAARERLSLSPLTLSHELARVVLYEQLFRVLSITAGMSYHRAPT